MVNKTDNTHSVKQEHLKSSVNVTTIQTVVKALNRKTGTFLLLKRQARSEIILLICRLGQQKHTAIIFSRKKIKLTWIQAFQYYCLKTCILWEKTNHNLMESTFWESFP